MTTATIFVVYLLGFLYSYYRLKRKMQQDVDYTKEDRVMCAAMALGSWLVVFICYITVALEWMEKELSDHKNNE